MDSVVTLSDAKARFSEIVEKAISGDEFIVTRMGKPVVRISRFVASGGRRKLGDLAGQNFVRCKDEPVIVWDPLWWVGSRRNGRLWRARRRVSGSFEGVCKANWQHGLPGRASGDDGAVVEPGAGFAVGLG